MSSEIIASIIGAVVGFGSGYLTLRLGYKDLYARTVSTNRMDWINNFREEISIVIAGIRCKGRNSEGTVDDIIYQAEKARAKLLTRLNMNIARIGNEYNAVMNDVLNKIDFSNTSISDQKYIETLIGLSRKILEPEWRRVKQEAGGDKR